MLWCFSTMIMCPSTGSELPLLLGLTNAAHAGEAGCGGGGGGSGGPDCCGCVWNNHPPDFLHLEQPS